MLFFVRDEVLLCQALGEEGIGVDNPGSVIELQSILVGRPE